MSVELLLLFDFGIISATYTMATHIKALYMVIHAVIHGNRFFAKVTNDVDRGWPISFEQFE